MAHHKLKLIGDGTSFGTELIDVETGENLFQKYAIDRVRVDIDNKTVGPCVWLKLWPDAVELSLTSPAATAAEKSLDIANPSLGQADGAYRNRATYSRMRT